MLKNLCLLLILLTFISCAGKKEAHVSVIEKSHGVVNQLGIGVVKAKSGDAELDRILEECVYADKEENSCSFEKLSLIRMETSIPTIEDLMKRVLVSHEWMRKAFREVLVALNDKELLQYFGSVNAIVIDSKVNPAFYWAVPGAIYLDGSYFWRTKEEYYDIVQEEDYREHKGDEYNFIITTASKFQGERVISFERKTRSIDEIKLGIVRLLYHELTHANDRFPSQIVNPTDLDFSLLVKSKSVVENAKIVWRNGESGSQNNIDTPKSIVFKRLATVFYKDGKLKKGDDFYKTKSLSGDFNLDTAIDFYSYSSRGEDTAVLFESFIMLHKYNVDKFIYFLDRDNFNMVDGEKHYNLMWGQKNRVAIPRIKFRAETLLKYLMADYHERENKNAGFLVGKAVEQLTTGGYYDDAIAGN
jgi:hypothetical protein